MAITTVEEFRQEVEQRRGGRRRGAPRYPAELVAFAVGHTRAVRASGRSVHMAASELGVSAATLSTWLSRAGKESGGRLREVVVAEVPSAPPSAADVCLEIVTASGHRVRGLTVAAAAALLRSLS